MQTLSRTLTHPETTYKRLPACILSLLYGHRNFQFSVSFGAIAWSSWKHWWVCRKHKAILLKLNCLSFTFWAKAYETYNTFQERLLKSLNLSLPGAYMIGPIHLDGLDLSWVAGTAVKTQRRLWITQTVLQSEHLIFILSRSKSRKNGQRLKNTSRIYSNFWRLHCRLYSRILVHRFTSNRNLLLIFARNGDRPTLGRQIVTKLERWAMFISN